jgi:hypothetical protein
MTEDKIQQQFSDELKRGQPDTKDCFRSFLLAIQVLFIIADWQHFCTGWIFGVVAL